MRFFQSQQENKFSFRILHIAHLSNRQDYLTVRNAKRPYQRYKDMKMAMKLIQKQQKPPTENDKYVIKSVPPSINNTPNSSVYKPATASGNRFRNKRMLVLHKKNASTLYKNMFAKTVSLNQLMSMH